MAAAAPVPPGTLVRLKVRAGDREDAIERRGPVAFEARVRAEARQGRANASALALLAALLGVPAGRLRIVKGATRPNKIVLVA